MMYSSTSRSKQNLDEAGRYQPVSFKSSQPIRKKTSLTVGEFQRQSSQSMKIAIGPSNYINSSLGIFNQYVPSDDESLEAVIKAAYSQVFGNKGVTSNQRLSSDEALLRNGEICVREFVNAIAKSSLYKDLYFYSVSPQRGIELNLKHLLGRPPIDKPEVSTYISMLASAGYDAVINSITDSAEYTQLFGDDTVPYVRTFISMGGMTTASFNLMSDLGVAPAFSDNALGKKSRVFARLTGRQAPSSANYVATSYRTKSSYTSTKPTPAVYVNGAAKPQPAVRFRAFGCK